MALLPARNILDGTALPVTSQMKTALGSLRDFLSDLLGTDSSNKAAARAALGAAALGANSDITSLSGLTTPLSLAQGGSGSATAFASSIGATGYQKLPSGLIIQWGTSTTVSGSATVTLPIVFTTALRAVTATVAGAANSVAVINSSSTSQIVIYTHTASTGAGISTLASWIAIGH